MIGMLILCGAGFAVALIGCASGAPGKSEPQAQPTRSDAAGTSAPPGTALDDETCGRLPDCALAGLCKAEGDQCVAKTDLDCAENDRAIGGAPSACETWGHCVAHDGVCRAKGKTNADCDLPRAGNQGSICRELGECTVVDGVCQAADAALCPKNDDGGPWTIEKGSCVRNPALCSATCGATGKCYFDRYFEVCREPPQSTDDCGYECAVGRCTARDGGCVVASDLDCQKFACPEFGLCKPGPDRCLATEAGCRESEECKSAGRCTAVRGRCVALRTPR